MRKYKKRGLKPHCQCCKKVDVKLMVISVSAVGNKYYLCRSCNTKRSKKYRSTKNGKSKLYQAVYKSMKKLAYKQNARATLNYHIRKGHIKKPKYCSVCDKRKKIEGHHNDYGKPLVVIWVCRSCHADIERGITHTKK